MEDEFHASLFDRSCRTVTLTEAGQAAVSRAETILAAYDGIADELAAGPGFAGRLRLGAIQTALAGRLPDALANMRREHPRLRISVVAGMSAELAQQIDAGDLDAAITTEPVKPYPASVAFTPLYADRFWVVAALEHKGKTARELLKTLPFLRFDKRAWAGRIIEDELRRQDLRVHEEMQLDSQEALTCMAASGLGVTIVPLNDEDIAPLPFGKPQGHLAGVLVKALKASR